MNSLETVQFGSCLKVFQGDTMAKRWRQLELELIEGAAVMAAIRKYEARKHGQDRPYGFWGPEYGHWIPNEDEIAPCCSALSEDTRSRVDRFMAHCKTLRHVASMFRLNRAETTLMRKASEVALVVAGE